MFKCLEITIRAQIVIENKFMFHVVNFVVFFLLAGTTSHSYIHSIPMKRTKGFPITLKLKIRNNRKLER